MFSPLARFLTITVSLLILYTHFIACKSDELYMKSSSEIKKNEPDQQKQSSPPALNNFGTKSIALIATRFKNLNHFKERVTILYSNSIPGRDTSDQSSSSVTLKYISNDEILIKTLTSGLDQGELVDIQKKDLKSKSSFVIEHPYAVRQRKVLEKMHILSRRRADLFGSKDVAFYDLAETTFRHINTPDLAYHTARDSSEKGFLNTFNHITAQAIITSFFSEQLAEIIGDMHERFFMPELTTGLFKENQLNDTINNPVDNYVDLLNNVIGQKLGMQLKLKYKLNENTSCSPELLSSYLNDLQSYYMWALGIGLEPFRASDPVVIKFSKKINVLLSKL